MLSTLILLMSQAAPVAKNLVVVDSKYVLKRLAAHVTMNAKRKILVAMITPRHARIPQVAKMARQPALVENIFVLTLHAAHATSAVWMKTTVVLILIRRAWLLRQLNQPKKSPAAIVAKVIVTVD